MTYALASNMFCLFFRFANAEHSKRLSMRHEIQNPQIFQPNPESFSRAIIFRRCPFIEKKIIDKFLQFIDKFR
jgi:hypothetical protein